MLAFSLPVIDILTVAPEPVELTRKENDKADNSATLIVEMASEQCLVTNAKIAKLVLAPSNTSWDHTTYLTQQRKTHCGQGPADAMSASSGSMKCCLLGCWVTSLLVFAASQSVTADNDISTPAAKITFDLDKGHTMATNLWGIFFEEV